MADMQDPGRMTSVATGAYHIAVRDYFVSVGPDKWFRRGDVEDGAMKLFHAERLHRGWPEPDHILGFYFGRIGRKAYIQAHPTEPNIYRLGAAGRRLIERWATESAEAKAAFRRDHPR
ncbi:hypothetical protein AB0A74_09700 [Saccharothrix sp. NPDC042600]|uniref:hypothetical protein n=1 Tax=Saccharothrix TaxID=2071 RepID=UPI0033E38DA1|nr:hypothetical protein GCM10017745_35780 [Saccharothrix mutabilis subsp. capreolus]